MIGFVEVTLFICEQQKVIIGAILPVVKKNPQYTAQGACLQYYFRSCDVDYACDKWLVQKLWQSPNILLKYDLWPAPVNKGARNVHNNNNAL